MKSILFLLAVLSFVSGCSVKRFAAETTVGVMGPAAQAFNEEGDLEFARAAMPANLKMMEGLLKSAPGDRDLLTLLARGYCSYAFAFIEESGKVPDLARAKRMYQRGYRYGLEALPEGVRANASGDLESFSRAVENTDDVAPLFWSAYCLGSFVNISKDDVAAVAELSRVEVMMKRILALDETFYHGSAHLFYGAYYGGRPKMLGGNQDKAREHLERAIKLTEGKFLMAKLYLAQFVAVPSQDEVLFESTLKEVIDATEDVMPDERLANLIVKQRAQALLNRKKDLF